MAVNQKLQLTPSDPSIDNNTTKLRILWTSTQTGESHNDYKRTAYYYVSINGGAETQYSASYTLPKGTTKTIVDTTLILSHDVEGKCEVTVRTYMDTGISAGIVELSETLTLDPIPRRSTLTVADGMLGEPKILTVIRTSDKFTHDISYFCGDASGKICEGSSDTSIFWTPPISLAKQNTTGNMVSITFEITTYNGSDVVGVSNTAIVALIPPSVMPTAQLELSDPKGYANRYGGYIQGKSQVSVNLIGIGSQGSDIEAYSIAVGDLNYSNNSSISDLPNAGELQIIGTVTDTRYRKGTTKETITVLEYKPPRITDLTVIRCDVNGNEDGDGDYAKVTFSAVVSALNNNNSALYKLQYRQLGENSWTEYTFSTAENDYNPTGVSLKQKISSGEPFEFRIVAIDDFEQINSHLYTIAGVDLLETDENCFIINPPVTLRSGIEEVAPDKKKKSREAFGLNQLLWEGICRDGDSITIENLQEYSIYRIDIEDYEVSIIAIRQDNTQLSGVGGTYISGPDGPRFCYLRAVIDGNTLSLEGTSIIDHIDGEEYTNAEDITITRIYGLL